jgi:phosphocarrier protein HPr
MSNPAGADDTHQPDGEPHAATVVRVLEICNKKGLHARASAKFVQTVERFDAEVRVTRGHETVGGTSIMGLMMLAAGPGTTITVEASGAEAAQAVEALAMLVAGRFTEGE